MSYGTSPALLALDAQRANNLLNINDINGQDLWVRHLYDLGWIDIAFIINRKTR